MSFIAVAIGGSAALGYLGSRSAANTQANAQTQAAQTQLGMFNTINQQQQPFIQGGYSTLNQLLYGLGTPQSAVTAPTRDQFTTTTPASASTGSLGTNLGYLGMQGGSFAPTPASTTFDQAGYDAALAKYNTSIAVNSAGNMGGITPGQFTKGFTPTDFLNNLDPGYQFQLQTGGQAIRNADTPGVGSLSGPALKDLMTFNQGLASTGYQNAFNRFQTQNTNIFGRLSEIAGLGQNAAANVGTSGTSLGTGAAQAQAAAGGSQAAGIVGATNSLSGAGVPLAYLLANQNNGGGGLGQSANLQGSTSQLFSGTGS